jgi:hypothetical protein
MDMDVDHVNGAVAAREDLQRAAGEDLGDHFSFAITSVEELREGDVPLAQRYRIECTVADTLFEILQVDVTLTPPEVWEAEPARRPGLLADVGLGPIDVLLVPLERQIAEKVHAYTRKYDGVSTRVRDLVDFVLIRTLERVDAQRLRQAITQTFAQRKTHTMPHGLPPPPADWEVAFRREADAVGVTTALDEAHRLSAAWLDPVLQGNARGTWIPKRGAWDETEKRGEGGA